MPFHCITVVDGNMTMPCFSLPQWNEIHAFHHTLMQVEGNYDNATLLTIA